MTWLIVGCFLGFISRPWVEFLWKLALKMSDSALAAGDDEPEVRTVLVQADVVQLSSGKCFACEAGTGSGRMGRVIAVMSAEIPVMTVPTIEAEVAPPRGPFPPRPTD